MLDMKDDETDPDRIEAQIEADRALVAAHVAALREQLSADALLLRGAIAARSQLASAARVVGGTVRDNPVAAGLAVAGIAWLVLGRKQKPAAPEKPLAGTKFESLTRWEDEGGPPSPETEPDPDPRDDWLEEAHSLRERLAQALKKLETAPKNPLSSNAEARRTLMQTYSTDLARTLRQGLGDLSTTAQDRIAAARAAALKVGETTQAATTDVVREYPLLTGVITALFGAAIAAWLPIGAREKSLLGPTADSLLDEARRIYEAERDRAAELAAELASGLQDDLVNAAGRVTDSAEELAQPPG